MKQIILIFRLLATGLLALIRLTAPGTQFVKRAIVQNPITGRTRGKFSTAIFSKWYNKNTMRSKPEVVRQPDSDEQLAQRQKFALVQKIIGNLLQAVRHGLSEYAIEKPAYNVALSHNLLHAVTGNYPNQELSMSDIMLSDGELAPALVQDPLSVTDLSITVVWVDNSDYGNASEDDKITVCFFTPSLPYGISFIDTDNRDSEQKVFTF